VYQNHEIAASGSEPPRYWFDYYAWEWRREQYVYLLHFDAPICPGHPTRHYIGWTWNLPERLRLHRAGRGARLTQVAIERGITWRVARLWRGDRAYERQIKRWKMAPRLCPICQQEQLENASPVIVCGADDIPF
jgi:predicted GIY-YIG superfamily endonuclease